MYSLMFYKFKLFLQALKAVFNSRRHMTVDVEAGKPVSVGYPPNAALAALNKHAADMFNPKELMVSCSKCFNTLNADL